MFRKLLPILIFSISGCSVFGAMNVQEPPYKVVEEKDGYEIREYNEVVLVQTTITGPYEKATDKAFNKLFKYISGNNISSENIEMTAPVIMNPEGVAISDASEFFTQETADGWTMSFVLPDRFNLENAPRPLDSDVSLVVVPSKKVAAINYTGTWSEENMEEAKSRLIERLSRDNVPYSSESFKAMAYNPPWAIPFLRRNEIQVEVVENSR